MGQTVVITGASAGVGRATAREFGKRGARLALIARGHEGLEATKSEIEVLGGEAMTFEIDVSDAEALEKAAGAIEKELGPVDVWVNNAMVSVFSPAIEMSPAEFKRVTEVTYLGYVYGTLAALKRMVPRNHGTVIQVGSALAYRSIPLQSAYCASKHAIVGFTESVRTELLHDKSRVNICMIHLPAVNTPQFSWVKSRLPRKPQPVPPIFQPEVPARAIAWLARHPKRELWLSFSTVKAILSEKIAPSLGDRYLARNGYDSQQTPEPDRGSRPDNLWKPIASDLGAHGSFDSRAKSRSAEFDLERSKWAIAAGFGLMAIGYLGYALKRR